MLNLSQSLGLSSIRVSGSAWTPASEGDLVAWYKNQTGILLNDADVSKWEDSANSYDMVQATATEQPAYNSGDIDFDSSDTQYLQSTSDIVLSGEFTFGIKLSPDATNVVVVGDNTAPNEFFKITSTNKLRFKTDGNEVDLSLDSGTFIGDFNLVVTRNSSDLITLWVNGVAQDDTETLAGTAEINAIGVRNSDNNPYDGTISEVQIYSSTSSGLTANVNDYLSSI